MQFWGLAVVLAEIAQRLERERQSGQTAEEALPAVNSEIKGAGQP